MVPSGAPRPRRQMRLRFFFSLFFFLFHFFLPGVTVRRVAVALLEYARKAVSRGTTSDSSRSDYDQKTNKKKTLMKYWLKEKKKKNRVKQLSPPCPKSVWAMGMLLSFLPDSEREGERRLSTWLFLFWFRQLFAVFTAGSLLGFWACVSHSRPRPRLISVLRLFEKKVGSIDNWLV